MLRQNDVPFGVDGDDQIDDSAQCRSLGFIA